jgi:hypothetical protein
MGTIEQQIGNSMMTGRDRTFSDKVMSREDIEQVKSLMRKERLGRSEINQLVHACLSAEAKLVNLSEWDRYVINKYFIWISEMLKNIELTYDYEDRMRSHGELTMNMQTLLRNCILLLEYSIKEQVNVYLNIIRTSLSVGATGFSELLNNRFEIAYPNQAASPQPSQSTTGGLFKRNTKEARQ